MTPIDKRKLDVPKSYFSLTAETEYALTFGGQLVDNEEMGYNEPPGDEEIRRQWDTLLDSFRRATQALEGFKCSST